MVTKWFMHNSKPWSCYWRFLLCHLTSRNVKWARNAILLFAKLRSSFQNQIKSVPLVILLQSLVNSMLHMMKAFMTLLKKLYDFLTLEYYHSIKYRWIHIHLLAFGSIVEHICFEDAPIWQSLVRGWSGLLSSKTACILSTNDWKKSSTAAFC